jgi:hypothetical protein
VTHVIVLAQLQQLELRQANKDVLPSGLCQWIPDNGNIISVRTADLTVYDAAPTQVQPTPVHR